MYAVTHFSVGLMLGQAVGNPYVACASGLISHIVLDSIPHSDYGKTAQGGLDFAAVLTVACIAIRQGAGLSGLLGGFTGILPDLEVAIAHLRMTKEKGMQKHRLRFPSHSGLIRHGRLRVPWGVATQIATVFVVWAVLRDAWL